MNAKSSSGIRVLILDDEEDFALTLAGRLQLRGMSVRCAFSGTQGLDCLREQPADILLLDMRMPGLSGVEVLRRVRAEQPELPVIIITGHCSEQDRQTATALGVQGYYTKPLQFEALLAAIREMAERK